MGLDLEGFAIDPTGVRTPSLTPMFKPVFPKSTASDLN